MTYTNIHMRKRKKTHTKLPTRGSKINNKINTRKKNKRHTNVPNSMRMRYATIGETMDVREKVWEKRTFQNENHNESLKHTNTPRNEIEFDDTLRCEDDKHAVQCSGHKSYK